MTTPDHSSGPRPPGGGRPGPSRGTSPTILRFLAGERMLHWALAIPFVLLYTTALGLLIFYGEPAPRVWRHLFGVLHRSVGVALIVLPPIALLSGARDWRVHFENLSEGWRWTRDDVRWLLLFPRAALNPKIRLPEEGKFNAPEKLNFMMVSATYPLYIITGLMVWMPGVAFYSYVTHFASALLGLPLMLGHIFMATVNPATRIGLSGMITGWVDRGWAQHHYRRWFRERIETPERERAARRAEMLLDQPSRVKCDHCAHVTVLGSWRELIERSFRVEPIVCPSCLEPVRVVAAEANAEVAEAILAHLDRGAESPFSHGSDRVA